MCQRLRTAPGFSFIVQTLEVMYIYMLSTLLLCYLLSTSALLHTVYCGMHFLLHTTEAPGLYVECALCVPNDIRRQLSGSRGRCRSRCGSRTAEHGRACMCVCRELHTEIPCCYVECALCVPNDIQLRRLLSGRGGGAVANRGGGAGRELPSTVYVCVCVVNCRARVTN